MLLAAALSTVLMMAVLLVLTQLTRDRKLKPRAQLVGDGSAAAVLEVLRADLAHARQLTAAAISNAAQLSGPMGVDPVKMLPTGRLAAVTYQLVMPAESPTSAQSGGVLVRRQQWLDDPRQTGAVWSECLTSGVATFSLKAEPGQSWVPDLASQSDMSTVSLASARRQKKLVLEQPPLDQIRIRLTWADPSRAPIDAVITTW